MSWQEIMTSGGQNERTTDKKGHEVVVTMVMFIVISFYAGRHFSTKQLSSDAVGREAIVSFVEDLPAAFETNLNSDEYTDQYHAPMDNLNDGDGFASQAESLSAGEKGEVFKLTGDFAEQLDTLVANPGTRSAAKAWIISHQEKP